MGHQVSFYLTPLDTALVEEALRDLGPIMILHSRSDKPEPKRLEALDFSEDGKQWLYFYLVRVNDLESVVVKHVPAQGYWTIDVLRSPVVEFTRSFFDGRILRRGRAYYLDSYYGPDDQLIHKPEAFRNWAKLILSTTKRKLKRIGSDYIGPDAEGWLKAADGRLVD